MGPGGPTGVPLQAKAVGSTDANVGPFDRTEHLVADCLARAAPGTTTACDSRTTDHCILVALGKVLPSVCVNVPRSFFSRESGEGLCMLPNDEPGVRFNPGMEGAACSEPQFGDFACHSKAKLFQRCVQITTAQPRERCPID